ncbi:VL96-like protein [Mya arenaria]|uniref:VL96-like protein n=1 Tax=Mya arenaria TaxID=6604 RepID=A0ABY7E7I1_MYAAR|nr:VL96-like protein [Mya arenaria]
MDQLYKKTTGRDNSPSSEQIRQDKRQVRETTDRVTNPKEQTIHNKIQIQVTDEVSKTNSTGNIETNNELTGQALKYDTTPEKPKRMQPTATNGSKNPALPQRKAGIAHTRGAPVPPGNTTPGRQWSESESDSDDENRGRRHRVVPMKPRFTSGNSFSTFWNKDYNNSSNSEWHDSEGSYSLTDYFDDDLIGEDQDMDKFDEIPPYDEIPYALICCGVYDEKSIRIAQKKQVQKKLLQNCQKESKIPSNVDKNGEIHQNDQERKEIEKEFDDLINDFKNIAEELSSGNTDKPEDALFETKQHQETEIQNKQTISQPLQTTFEENDILNPDNRNPPFTTSSTDCTNSLKMLVTRNSKTSTAYEETGGSSKDYLNKNKTDLKNVGTTILETQKDVQRPPSPVNGISSADEENTKLNCPSRRQESEQTKRMREKRLQKFQQGQKSTRAGNRNTQKLDNRDLAPNSQPLLKPIKCQAFKHNLTVLNKELENKDTIRDEHDNKTQHEMPREVKQMSVSKKREYSTITETADEKTREIFDTQHNKSSNETDSDDDSVVPTAMRVRNTSKRRDETSKSINDFTDQQNGQKLDNGDIAPNARSMSKSITCTHDSSVEVLNKEQENKEAIHDKHDNKTQHETHREVKQENVSTERVNSTRTIKAGEKQREIKEKQHTLSSNESDSDDDSVVPTAMRALNTPDRNDKASKSKRDFADTLLDTLLSISTDIKTKPALKGSGKQNKNKTSQSSSGSGILKDKVSKPCMNDEERKTFIDTIESTLETKAETLHFAFEHLRMKQSRLPKCPACGSTDCKEKSGGAVQELVVAARKEGYEVHDVSPDGNCMFAALVDQLEMYGDTRFDARSLRETAVKWLKEHPRLNDGENTHFQSFIDENWDVYLQRMSMDGEWGDHLQLRAVSNVVESTIKVLSIRNRDVVWTSIGSDKDSHSSDRVLTVGNVNEQTAEVAMFESDYVDPLEKMPKTYHNQPMDIDPVPVGSFMEGTFHPALCWLEGKDNEMKHWQNSVCSDLHLLRIDEVLPKDVAGTYAESEVPMSFTLAFDSFCHDYAAFLAFVGKKSEALHVLEFCAKKHRQYQSHLKEMTKTGKDIESCAFKDENMFCVYAAIFALYNKEQENEKFCEYSDEASELVTRMKMGYAFLWLKTVFGVLYGEAGLKRLADQPKNSTTSDIEMSVKFMYWPVRYLTS